MDASSFPTGLVLKKNLWNLLLMPLRWEMKRDFFHVVRLGQQAYINSRGKGLLFFS